ncbi:alpha/beta hydrolase [Deminuibacter soli]|nr:alpha/beta hydrolase [Deminuibacter soli]
MKNVYFLSGLGADERMFQALDLSFCKPVFVPWIQPGPQESLPAYASRLRQTIPEENPCIVGLSFGGMLTVEMAKLNNAIKAIIISSAKTRSEIPAWIKLSRFWPLHRYLPHDFIRWFEKRNDYFFGPLQPDTKKVLNHIIDDSDLYFDAWAVDAIISWQNNEVPGNLVHIHGDADRLLPYSLVYCNETITGGSHLMVMDHATEVTTVLRKYITGMA